MELVFRCQIKESVFRLSTVINDDSNLYLLFPKEFSYVLEGVTLIMVSGGKSPDFHLSPAPLLHYSRSLKYNSGPECLHSKRH